MKNNELIKTILNSADPLAKLETSLENNEIAYYELLNQDEQENLMDLFDTDIYGQESYSKFPIFYKINDYFNSNDINLNEFDLDDSNTRLDLLEKLFNIIKESEDYSVYSARILFEIILAIDKLEVSNSQNYITENLYKDIIDLCYQIYAETNEIICIENITNSLASLSYSYLSSRQVNEILGYYEKLFNILKPQYFDDLNVSFYYLANLVDLIQYLMETKHFAELEKYLRIILDYCKQYLKENKLSLVGLIFNLNLLTTIFLNLISNKKLEALRLEFIELLETLLKNENVEVREQESLLVNLSILYLSLKDLESSVEYLEKEAKLVKENNLEVNPFIKTQLSEQLMLIHENIDEKRFNKLLSDLFQVNNIDELYQSIIEDFRDETGKETSDSIFEIQKDILEQSERDSEIRYNETPNSDTLIMLIFEKTGLAFFSIGNNDFDKAYKKIYESEELLKELEEYLIKGSNVIDDYNRTKFEIEFLKAFVSFLEKEDSDIDEFIEITNDLINSTVRNYNVVFFLSSPISPLIKAAEILIQREEFDSAFQLIKKINEEFKGFSAAQEDLETVESFLSVLIDLESSIQDKEILNSIEQIINEVSSYLDKIYFSETEYILNVKYINLAENYEDIYEYDKAIENYKKALKLLLLYPDSQRNKRITYELGKGYLGLGGLQREFNQTNEAINSYKNGLNYLTKFNLNKNDSDRLIDILITNSYLAQLYFEKEDYKESFKILERQDKFIKNVIEDIEDEFLLKIYLEELHLRFFILQKLERYSDQKELLEEFLLLFNNDLVENDAIEEALLYLSSMINLNKDIEGSPQIWSWKKYISEIFNKLQTLKISKKLNNLDVLAQRAAFEIYLSYIEYCLDLNKPIPDDLLTNTIKLARKVSVDSPEESNDLLEIANDLEFIRDEQRSIITRSFTKKKKVYKKRAKKTTGRNKRRKKKR